MGRSLNRVQLIGNLGKDPEVRSTSNGGRVANFTLATSRTWNSQAGERQEKTEWHNCVAWNSKNYNLADIVERYCKKGKQVYVEGEIEYRSYEKEGQTRYITEIKVRELILLGGRGGDSDDAGAPPAARSSRPPAERAKTSAKSGSEDFDDFPGALEESDDDLPF
ncbi:MAG TPA: single-stranded DNA-binding protein [Gemmatimonadaceae bacterium]|jgi:single-strand DNA-binding protein|nr:single-stranded DNA-binding protein [Gemmatimonadaceae bacterium]